MEAIKCPNCGSEKVQAVTEDKYVCLACDNIFLVYNRSKEFRQTDEHITSMHQDLKEDISRISTQNFQNLREDLGRMSDRNYLDEQATLEKAEGHMRNGAFATAFEFFSQVATDYPRRSAGWYGMYRALTGEMTQVDRYARFVCGGQYIDLQEGEEESWFEGNLYIKNALSCEDADEVKIKREVTQFIKKCAEYGKQDIENRIHNIIDVMKNTEPLCSAFSYKKLSPREYVIQKLILLLPAMLVIVLILALVKYFFAADWLGKVFAVVIIALIVKFTFGIMLGSIGTIFDKQFTWQQNFRISIFGAYEKIENEIDALSVCCIDLKNYTLILSELESEDKFFNRYINNLSEGLYEYTGMDRQQKVDFLFEFLTGGIEEFRYFLGDDVQYFEEDEEFDMSKFVKKYAKKFALFVVIVPSLLFLPPTITMVIIAAVMCLQGVESVKYLTGKLKNLTGGEKNPTETSKSFTNGIINLTENLQSSMGGSKGNQGHSGASFCSACGSAVEENAVFCTKCGAKLG